VESNGLDELGKLGHRPGGYGNAVEDYWPQPGRSLMQAHPYLPWLSNIKALKLVKAVAGLEKSNSGVCIKLASMTPGNTEYQKYNPPGAQNSDDALAKVSSVYSTLSAKM
jgi:hypothetical protein